MEPYLWCCRLYTVDLLRRAQVHTVVACDNNNRIKCLFFACDNVTLPPPSLTRPFVLDPNLDVHDVKWLSPPQKPDRRHTTSRTTPFRPRVRAIQLVPCKFQVSNQSLSSLAPSSLGRSNLPLLISYQAHSLARKSASRWSRYLSGTCHPLVYAHVSFLSVSFHSVPGCPKPNST